MKDPVVSGIEERIAAWTLLPQGKLLQVFNFSFSYERWLMSANESAFVTLLCQRMLRTFRYSDTRTDKNMILILIIFKTKSINCRAVTVMQRC